MQHHNMNEKAVGGTATNKRWTDRCGHASVSHNTCDVSHMPHRCATMLAAQTCQASPMALHMAQIFFTDSSIPDNTVLLVAASLQVALTSCNVKLKSNGHLALIFSFASFS